MFLQNLFPLDPILNRCACVSPVYRLLAGQLKSIRRLVAGLAFCSLFSLWFAIGGVHASNFIDDAARSTNNNRVTRPLTTALPIESARYPGVESFLWKLNPEDQFSVELNQRVTTVTSIDRRDVTLENEIQLRQVWQVLEPHADDNFRIRQTIESIRLKVGNAQFPGQAFILDSQSDLRPHRDAVELNRQVKEMIGISFLVTMRPSGEVIAANLEAESKIKLDSIAADHPLKVLLSEQGMATALSGVTNFNPHPSSDSQSGEGHSDDGQSTWLVTDELENSFGSFTRTRNYQIQKKETIGDRELVTIQIESTISPKQIKFDGSALLDSMSETGEIEYDSTGGIFTRSKMQQSINSRLQYAGELLNMRLNSETEIKIRKQN